jgi:hypothetical protein
VVVVQHSVTRVMVAERQWHGIVMGTTAAASSQVHVHVGWTCTTYVDRPRGRKQTLTGAASPVDHG